MSYADPLPELEQTFQTIVANFNGRVGVCANDGRHVTCVHGDQRFSMQSVVKMITGMAVYDAADRGQLKIDELITLYKKDRVGGVEPIGKLIDDDGYTTTLSDLVHRTIVDSDTIANDVLMDRLGGARAVQDFLDRKHITGIRVDRDERRLQSQIIGLDWQSEFSDPAIQNAAIAAIPLSVRNQKYRDYSVDPRDTVTPHGMALLLYKLASGELLSPVATQAIMTTMQETKTFPTRLKAGLRDGWQIGHKTGSSGTWNGMTVATNDVGFLTTPAGKHIALAVFVADSLTSDAERNTVIAKLARATVEYYTQHQL